MPQRRPHTKSRDGCNRCKKRRIKCDESGPPCGTCKARNAPCEYPSNFRASNWTEHLKPHPSLEGESIRTTEPSEQITTAGRVQDHPGAPLTFTTKRMRELQLMNHWTLKTCYSFSPLLGDVFRTFVVAQAIEFPFLMDSLLALTLLHITSELSIGAQRTEYLSDALQYQSGAMPAFRTELEIVSSINCHALFACSVIIMAYTFVFPSLELTNHAKQGPGAKMPTDLKTLFHLVKGIHSIIDQARPALEEGPFDFIIQPWSGARPTSLHAGEGMLPPVLRQICCRLEEQSQDVYKNAVDTLETFAMAEGMVIPWIVLAGEEFVERVENEDPLALLIYTCWAALIGRLKEMWWANIAGKKIVQSLVEKLASRDEDWDEVLRWAKEISQTEKL